MSTDPKDYFKRLESTKESDFKRAKTFEEWEMLDRHVRKGEKCIGRNDDGEPIFTRKQTEETVDPVGDWDEDDHGCTIWDTF